MQASKQLVFFENWVDPVAEQVLAARPEVQVHRLHYADPAPRNWEQLERAHGYQISGRGELRAPWFGDAALLARCPSLLAISSTGAGFDVVDLDACTAAGVLVVNQSGSNHEAVAEHAIGMMLALCKNIALTNRVLKRVGSALERWSYAGTEVRGKVLGIAGIGTIGTRTALLANALGMQVIAYDPYLTESQVAARGATKVDLAELLRRADFVSPHCPLTPETQNLFGAAEFAAMKKGAFFVNTARGGTYDEAALLRALDSGHVAGAGLDVFLQEPPATDHPLLLHERVIATPHIAGMTKEAMHDMARFAAEQWLDIFDGQLPPRLKNPAAWPRYCERFERLFGIRPRGEPASTK